jgi:hypothetical protein
MRRGELRQRRLVDRVHRDHRDANRRLGQDGRRALAALEHRALPEQGAGPDLGDRFAVDLDVDDPSSSRKSSSPGSPSRISASPCLTVRRSSFLPSRMIEADSSRSRSDSTAVVSAGESSSPQGVFLPCEVLYHSRKSIVPDFSTNLPASS